MKFLTIHFLFCLLACCLTSVGHFCVKPACADVIINMIETNGDVVASYTDGEIDLTLLSFWGPSGAAVGGNIGPDEFFIFGSDPAGHVYRASISGPDEFGTTDAISSSDFDSGDIVGLDLLNNVIILPNGYTSNSTLTGSSTFVDETFASLGVTPGKYNWMVGSNNVTLCIVPEPLGGEYLFVGIGLFLVMHRGRRKPAR